MSLLLDALKKAADDKQKAADRSADKTAAGEQDNAAQTGDSEAVDIDAGADSELPPLIDDDALSLELPEDNSSEDARETAEPEELELQSQAAGGSETDTVAEADTAFGLTRQAITEGELTLDEGEPEIDRATEQEPPEQRASARQSTADSHDNSAVTAGSGASESYNVSQEALSMLINKTNRQVKNSRRLVILSGFLLTLLALLTGGYYHYANTQEEIANLERKHRIAMQAMKAKTSSEKDPDNVEVIRNLVSDSKLEEKVEYAKKLIKDSKKSGSTKSTTATAEPEQNSKQQLAGKTLSIQKTDTVDPIARRLDDAWLAYGNADYARAKQYYQQVLEKEQSNRDALLGLGAIAITEKDNAAASKYYLALLEQDPRDPIATAALSSLNIDASSLQLHEEHLLSLLEKNPEAAPLSFALGNIYARQQSWKSAQQSYFTAWQNDPENADYLFNLAVSMDQLDKPQQALDFYRQCLQKSTDKSAAFSRQAVQKRIDELSGS